MVAELAPRHDLEELVESAEPPGERQEAGRHLRHPRLALVHRRDDVEMREAAVRDLFLCKARRDDAVDGRALLERGVREDAHEPDAPAAVNEARAGASDRAPDGRRVFGVNGREACARTAENGEQGTVERHRHPGMMHERPARAVKVAGVSPPIPLDRARADLRDALLRHTPADAREEIHRKAILRLVETEPACFSRQTFTPGHITGSAFVVCRSTGKVLLHHHRRLNAWLQLGGHDDGEHDPRATALREAAEESGLKDLKLLSDEILDVDVHDIPAGKGEPPHKHHDVRYALVTERPEGIVRDAAESLDLAWFTLEEAAKKMNESGASRALARLAKLI